MNNESFLSADASNRSVVACPRLSVSLIVPVYNEVESVDPFLSRIRSVFDAEASVELDILFVNDGSSDGTLDRLLQQASEDNRIRVVDLSRNFGKEAALTAGINAARGRVVVPIDVDLQDPPEIILQMVEKWREGFDVVLGRRSDRATDSWLKRTSATWFYRIHNTIADPSLPENVGDFRLMDRTVVDALSSLPESRRFMKGIFAWVGFPTTFIDYVRPERIAGKSKFNGWRLWNFALEGVTSFSTAPLRVWTYIGVLVACAALAYGSFIALKVLVQGVDVPGFASVFVAVTFLGGIQLIGIGVVGEYVGRVYLESKRRPVYLVRRVFESSERVRKDVG
jgi:glycosyltransferase involved in cell wall biosynthesis